MRYFLTLISVFVFSLSHAQWNWPVQVNTITTGPYYNYLSYYADQNDHLQVMVTLTDPSATSVPAKLRVRIEGPGYWLETKPLNNIPQLTLEAFSPNNISGVQLAPYFFDDNLIKSSDQLDINNLPEGLTTVCVEVIGVGGTLTISGNQCSSFWLQRFQPPQQISPLCESVIDTNEFAHIFQWTPPIGYVPTLTSELNYTFSLYEWVDPSNYTIFQTGQGLVHQTITEFTQIQLTDFDVQLQSGMNYVWRVQAAMTDNGMPVNIFENNGLSEICTFTYGQAQSLEEVLTDGLYIDLNAEASTSFKGRAFWTVIDNTPGQGLSTYDRYFVEYRKKPDSEHPNPTWFYDTVPSYNHFIYQLGAGNTYQVRVSGIAGSFVSAPSNTVEFTTPPPIDYSCGDQQMPYRPSNYTPNENVLAGDRVQIGQFLMTVSEAIPTGTPGRYQGKGTIPIKFLADAKAKVTFDDILIDEEFVVREGRVDVITDGLDAWLHEQYQQFIDPIYVDGTIDSAWVDTTAGTAWVVVDGVSQSFTFDPPDYPIIINDESGYQWTIWPNGTITVEGYLDPSEQWTVNADQVAIFAQNNNESFGFDPKEHMQWHENYEVIELSDSSYYFVANKSIGKGQTDLVDATLPGGVTPVFKLDDQTDVSATSSGDTYTLQLPSIQQTGEHSIYVYDGSTRMGKLNLYVYSPKERDVVIVPVANVSIDTAQLQQTLQQTLGEANLTFNIFLKDQWNDSIFTNTKTIALPQEVGLMNKYSQDMRDLRNAYFEANPNASKNKYYLFVISGFDDPLTDGYMVRGKGLGFVTGNDYLTYAHELAHGMGALEHTWKNNGPSQGATTNLMDYTAGAENLTKMQWKELRDWDVFPSLMDEVEDASAHKSLLVGFESSTSYYGSSSSLYSSSMLHYTPSGLSFDASITDIQYNHCTGAVEYFLFNGSPYYACKTAKISDGNTSFRGFIGYSDNTLKDSLVQIKLNGIDNGWSNSQISANQWEIIERNPTHFFSGFTLGTTGLLYSEFNTLTCERKNAVFQINIPFTETSNPIEGYPLSGSNKSIVDEQLIEHAMEIVGPGDNCEYCWTTSPAFASKDDYFPKDYSGIEGTRLKEYDAHPNSPVGQQLAERFANKINNNLRGNKTHNYIGTDQMFHIIGSDNYSVLSDEEKEELEHKLAYLYDVTKEKTGQGTEIYVVFGSTKVDGYYYLLSDFNDFAKEVYKKSNLNGQKATVITVPVGKYPSQDDSSPTGNSYWDNRTCYMPGMYSRAKIDYTKLKPEYDNAAYTGAGVDLAEFIEDVYIHSSKPYEVYNYVMDLYGRIMFNVIETGTYITGQEHITQMRFFKDVNVWDYNKKLRLDNTTQPTGNTYVMQDIANFRESFWEIEMAYTNGTYEPEWIDVFVNIKEVFIHRYHAQFIQYYMEEHYRFVRDEYGLSDVSDIPSHAKKNALLGDVWLETLDFLSLITSPIGGDYIFDAIGVIYTYSVDPDNYEELSHRITAASLPFLSGGLVSAVKPYIKNIDLSKIRWFGRGAKAGSAGKLTYRLLNSSDTKLINRVKELRQKLTSSYKKSGNFGHAEVNITNLSKSEFYAHSGIDELTGTLPNRVPEISLKPDVQDEIFPWTSVPASNGVLIDRNIDTEYKILNEIAQKLGDNPNVVGEIKLFTERPPCSSCSGVIDLFHQRYPLLNIEIIHNNGILLTNF